MSQKPKTKKQSISEQAYLSHARNYFFQMPVKSLDNEMTTDQSAQIKAHLNRDWRLPGQSSEGERLAIVREKLRGQRSGARSSMDRKLPKNQAEMNDKTADQIVSEILKKLGCPNIEALGNDFAKAWWSNSIYNKLRDKFPAFVFPDGFQTNPPNLTNSFRLLHLPIPPNNFDDRVDQDAPPQLQSPYPRTLRTQSVTTPVRYETTTNSQHYRPVRYNNSTSFRDTPNQHSYQAYGYQRDTPNQNRYRDYGSQREPELHGTAKQHTRDDYYRHEDEPASPTQFSPYETSYSPETSEKQSSNHSDMSIDNQYGTHTSFTETTKDDFKTLLGSIQSSLIPLSKSQSVLEEKVEGLSNQLETVVEMLKHISSMLQPMEIDTEEKQGPPKKSAPLKKDPPKKSAPPKKDPSQAVTIEEKEEKE